MSLPFTNWPDMLADVRRKPGMYIGGRSVEKLHCMLLGFRYAEYQYDIPEANRLGGFDFNAFEEWIAARYNPERLSVGSYWLAREAAGSDEGGFELWFRWYDEFRARTPAADEAAG
jgi:hypothetical protein